MVKSASKIKLRYTCNSCGTIYASWQGQCNNCKEWSTIEQEAVSESPSERRYSSHAANKPVPMETLTITREEVVSTTFLECDRVLGHGFVRGSVTLLGGEPGIGKSTLALQVAQKMASSDVSVLYISGEESLSQLCLRSKRCGVNPSNLFVLSETNIFTIIAAIKDQEPDVIILDSIQVLCHPDISSIPGSVNQVRQCASDIINIAKKHNIITLMIGHITKEGGLAGPKVLEHLVDVILYLEGDRNQQFRLLRSFKNRYSSTRELGIFEMKKDGLAEVSNPSSLFIDDDALHNPGSLISAVAEGSRIILVELQALVVDSGYGMAKRTFLGVDPNRCNLMIAAIEKILGLKLSSKDIILNIVGGIKITEPALDLALILAIVSSYYNISLPKNMAVFGEVGLTGEVRPVSFSEHRLTELKKLGFESCILPKKGSKNIPSDMDIHLVTSIKDALQFFN